MSHYPRAKQYAQSVYAQEQCCLGPFDLVRRVIHARGAHLPLPLACVAGKGKSAHAHEVLDARQVAREFDAPSYATMTNDAVRNGFYAEWIAAALAGSGHTEGETDRDSAWLEVGPGPDAVLARLLLSAAAQANRRVSYIGVEINDDAYQRARQCLKSVTNARVLRGFVGPLLSRRALPAQVHGIVHELLGFIASSEGVALAMHTLRTWFPQAESVPAAAATFVVPMELNADRLAADPALIVGPRWLRTQLDFAHDAMSDGAALLEWLDFRPGQSLLLQQTRVDQRVQVKRAGSFNALGLFVWLGCPTAHSALDEADPTVGFDAMFAHCAALRHGQHRQWSFTTSNSSVPRFSSNWSNLALVLPQACGVRKGQTLSISATVQLATLQPAYEISVAVPGVQHPIVCRVSYSDLYGRYVHLHTLRKEQDLCVEQD